MMTSPAAIGSGIWFPHRRESFPSSTLTVSPIEKDISQNSQARKSRILGRVSVNPLVTKVESNNKFDAVAEKTKTNDSLASVLFENSLNSVAKTSTTKENSVAKTSTTKENTNRLNTAENIFPVIRYPVTTESGIKAILESNTLVFVVDKRADKPTIKDTFEKMFLVKAKKVNTLLTPDGTKRAFVMLTRDFSAVDVAKRVKIL